MGKLDSMGVIEFTRELNGNELFQFLLWLKDKGIGNIRNVPIGEFSELYDKFDKERAKKVRSLLPNASQIRVYTPKSETKKKQRRKKSVDGAI